MESSVAFNQSVHATQLFRFVISLYLSPISINHNSFPAPEISRACVADEIKGGYQLVAVKRLSSTEVGNLE